MSFAVAEAADRRLVILRYLAAQPDYSLNESVMLSGLEVVGHAVSRSQIAADYDWLAEKGLITIREIMDGKVRVGTLTVLGDDVAKGRERVEGVKRPGPG